MKKTKTEKIYFVIFGIAVFAWLWSSIDFINYGLKDADRNETKKEMIILTPDMLKPKLEFSKAETDINTLKQRLEPQKSETDIKSLIDNFTKLLDGNIDDNWSISALDINKTGLEIDNNKTGVEK